MTDDELDIIEAAAAIADQWIDPERVRADVSVLVAEVRRLREAIGWYADIKNYDEDTACPGMLVGGGWAGTEPQEADWDPDYGERARKALGLPNPWDWPDYMM